MRHLTEHSAASEQPYFLMTLASIGFLGCAALIIGTLVAQTLVPDYNWISDTISDLAAGRGEIVMDVSLYGFAAGLFAVSLASSHAHLGGKSWSAAALCFALLAALVVIVGARNEYGDGDHDGVVIHIYLVYGLGALFALAPACMARAIGRHHGWARRALIGLTLAWVILCPVFLWAPTGFDGLIERTLGLIACGIICTLCTVFFLRGQKSAHQRSKF
ncbi:DUF998 domain-containing protein [Paracoccus liaowanqingii]|uniref:DUF998 domain-containing protein n=1 Tax=Paracoccus liaowanqingii TaxID=2560053 RepID=A0A4Z1CLQ8_9RHOB|nr:DUF998 domain-containing protein [Paracoccus liaowanqingii]TGN61823.1 DUF998 domain-containing protein [Paracoccus liaowanqingii]